MHTLPEIFRPVTRNTHIFLFGLSEEIELKIVIMFSVNLNLIVIYGFFGIHDNCLNLKILLNTHNIQFDGEI